MPSHNSRAFARFSSRLLATSALVLGAGSPAFAAPGAADVSVAPYASIIKKVELNDGPEPQIVVADPRTPAQAVDPTNITGVGQMVVDNGGGNIGLCTGSLINPRTVILAAHCVNTRAASAYGKPSGGVGIGFGFQADTLPTLRTWLLPTVPGGATNAQQFQTNVAGAFYNANMVTYNPLSLEPAARSFLYGDVALASLDTPAANIPNWILLFSTLSQVPITANGTGYNVQINGYGLNGTGQAGSNASSDFRRRIAENMIGALTSVDKFEQFLFGSAPGTLTQNLYFMDFDDPRRALTGASPFDFNAFRDNARPNEGITASGDSGGPLVVQNFARPVIAGVLSGGYTRFFNGQPNNSYGTVSFYQPLYLYWDWIAANNPYRYVAAAAGDGRWADAARWTTTLDPAYQILSGGQLVNGIPNDPGAQKAGTTGQFGEICFQNTATSECLNVATNVTRIENRRIGTDGSAGVADNGAGSGFVTADGAMAQGDGTAAAIAATQFDGPLFSALPPSTIVNGLPGATGFVPNNVDGNRLTGAIGRYFDVTLGAAGTTTLDIGVTIDRLTLNNAGARLAITSAGSLTSLIDMTQRSGVTQVDGTLTSRGDFLVMGGGLTGSGRINAPFTTSVAASIAPGAEGTVGTLTIAGNLILASASSLVIDLGPSSTSDRVAVVATNFIGTNAVNGNANLGGRVAFDATPGTVVRNNDLYTILTAQGQITGTFAAPTAISAILTPTFIYTANAIQVRIAAGSYGNVIARTPVQIAYAALLDQNRASGAVPAIYDTLDLQSAATIQATFEGLAPRTEQMRSSLGVAATDTMARLYRDRIAQLTPGALRGTLAYIGRPVQTAAALTTMQAAATRNDSGDSTTTVREGRLPDTMSGFLAGGYIDGSSLPMATAVPLGGRDKFDGFFLAAGVETEVGEHAVVGASLSYTDLRANSAFGGQSATAQLYQGSLYGKLERTGYYLDGLFSAGLLRTNTVRGATIVGNTSTLRGRDGSLAVAGEVGLGKMFGGAVQIGPRFALRGSYIAFSRLAETGGVAALAIDRDRFATVQGRAGLMLKGSGRVRPFGSITYVYGFNRYPVSFEANFVGGAGANQVFALSSHDRHWIEASGGLAIDTGNVEMSVGVDSMFERQDVRNQSYRAAIKVRF